MKNQGRFISLLLLALLIISCQATSVSPVVTQSARITATEFGGAAIVTFPPPTITAAIPNQLLTKDLPSLTFTAGLTSTASILPSGTVTVAQTLVAAASLKVHFIDVGQGDAILIQTSEGIAGLIDGGEPDTGIVAYLQSQGIKHLSLVVATHPHSDHIGGLVQVLQTIPVDRVVTDGETYNTATFEHFLDAITTAKAQYIEVKRGDKISLGSLSFDVLSSGGVSKDDMNQNSVVLRMTYAKTTFLFMGDAGKVVEATLAGMNLSADILKVGHHGSNTASSPAFLNQVRPKVAVYMAGLGNSYGHPAAVTISALTAVGAQIYGTDVNGTVVITVDGSGYSIKTSKQGNPQAPPITQPTTAVVPTTMSTEVSQSTPLPTQKSTGNLTISVVSLTSPIKKGATATLTISTLPGAACTITVLYKSGASSAAGLGPKTSDGSGNVTWSWKVGTNTTSGTWSITVTSSLNGQKISQSIPFTVQ